MNRNLNDPAYVERIHAALEAAEAAWFAAVPQHFDYLDDVEQVIARRGYLSAMAVA